ncbi:type I-G CRISPR-associated protein Csb2 [Azohydromonas lata]|uniref:type I-G CRISPR-associated protein Csb2 n=1 Tax=Azohydromonas lata TaxID=45677 RepID=UPI00082F1E30|nr:type I-U CRISPR-associated protein Csb2 [Azohydromonas lata]
MLQLQIGFPGGRYCAADHADPRRPEWPPHPSRVFSALVAAAYAGGCNPSSEQRAVLRKLEASPPPALCFPQADLREAPDIYVPVNDVQTRIASRKAGSALAPNRRVRQFPGASLLAEPEVRLQWPLVLSAQELALLDGLAARMTHLGTSHSLVTARFVADDTAPAPDLVPAAHGREFLRVTKSGRLEELDRLATQGHGALRRPQPVFEVLQPYARASAPAGADHRRSDYEWIGLRLDGCSWGADTAHTLARAARRAAMSLLGEHVPAALHGHDGLVRHVAWLPLADVGHAHARGKVRGIGVALPVEMEPNDRALTLMALSRLRQLHLPDDQVAQVTPVGLSGTPLVLREDTWREASTHWSTVTPVLLDRPPKRPEVDRLVDALVESLAIAGFPVPQAVHLSRTSDFEGAPRALDIPTRMQRWHAQVCFDRPIEGPVIAGRWRNFGIGLFRPTPQELRT